MGILSNHIIISLLYMEKLYYNKYMKYKNKYAILKESIFNNIPENRKVLYDSRNKNKYMKLLKQLGGNHCTDNFQNNYNVKVDGVDKSVYIGMTNSIDNKIIDTPCNSEIFNTLYTESKTYLDSLSFYQNFILWMYTMGSTARIINSFKLNKYTVDDLFSDSITEYVDTILDHLLKVILQIFIFKNKFKIDVNEKIDKIYDILIERIISHFKSSYKKYKTLLKKYKNDGTAIRNEFDEFIKLSNTFELLQGPINIIKKKEILNNMSNIIFDRKYLYEFFLQLITENINKDIVSTLLTELIAVLDTITINAPKITTCIKLYKTVKSGNINFVIGEETKQLVINSVTCSRETNIGMFIGSKDSCCMLEIECKIGTPILFLDYMKTAYGSNMYEVILPPNVIFKPILTETKDILSYRFNDNISDMNKLDGIKPFIELTYKKPYVKKIQIYLIECYM